MSLRNTKAPMATKSKLAILRIKVMVKVIDPGVIWKVSLVEYACQIWRFYLSWFKSYGQGSSFYATERQIDRQTFHSESMKI